MSSILINKDWSAALVESISDCKNLEEAENKLIELGFSNQIYGIESIQVCGRSLKYINRGDTYDTTICSEDGNLFAGSWGGWLEQVEEEFEREEGKYKCCYCGEFHDNDNAPDGWDSDGSHCVYLK